MPREELLNTYIEQYGSQQVIQILEKYLTDARVKRIDEVIANRLNSVQIAMESPYDILNAQAVVRSAEAMGVDHVHIITSQLRKNKGRKTASGSSRWVNIHWYETFPEFRTQIGQQGFLLAGASLNGSLTLEQLPVEQPICLLLGNENRGLSPEAASACDLLYRIPMYGMVESFNLSVSAGLSLDRLVRNRRGYLKSNGDLSDEQRILTRAKYFITALGFNMARMILDRENR